MEKRGEGRVRRLLYVAAAAGMAVGGVGMALLPRLSDSWQAFVLLAALFSALGGGGWVLSGATAGDWPRLRGGWVLMGGAAVAAVVSLIDWHPLGLLWACGQGLSGALLIFPVWPARRTGEKQRRPGPVQAPPTRRSRG